MHLNTNDKKMAISGPLIDHGIIRVSRLISICR